MKLASHAQAMENARTSGPRAGTLRGTDALADLVIVTTTYTIVGDETGGGEIALTAELPEGLVLVPALSRVVINTTSGTLEFYVGTKESPQLYSGQSAIELSNTNNNVHIGVVPVVENSESTQIIVTLDDTDALLADETVDFYLVFRAVS